MVTVTSDADKRDDDRIRTDEEEDEDIDNKINIDEVIGYDYDNLYGLLALPIIGLLLSLLSYLLKRY